MATAKDAINLGRLNFILRQQEGAERTLTLSLSPKKEIFATFPSPRWDKRSEIKQQPSTNFAHKLDEAVYATTACTRLYLRPVELQLRLALGFTPIRLAVLLCWQVWIRRSTGVGISWALSGESGRRPAGTAIQPLIVSSQRCRRINTTRATRSDGRLVCAFAEQTPFCRSARKSTTQCAALPHQPCSRRPNIAQKEATASSSLLLGPNPSHHPPQCGTYILSLLFILPGRLLIRKIYASYHFSLCAPFRTRSSYSGTLCWKHQIKHTKGHLKPGKLVKTVTFAAAFSANRLVILQSCSNRRNFRKLGEWGVLPVSVLAIYI